MRLANGSLCVFTIIALLCFAVAQTTPHRRTTTGTAVTIGTTIPATMKSAARSGTP